MEIQNAFSSEEMLTVRIGMHSGDVVRKDNNVYGDSINIASRIESLGIPGSILMSKNLRDQVKSKADFLLASLGSFDFKNVQEPIEVFALANPGFIVPKKEELGGKLAESLTPSTKKKKWPIPVGVGILLLGALAFWKFIGPDSLNVAATSLQSPLSKEMRDKRVAVFAFENQTMNAELDGYGNMISDWITSGLMETGEAQVISTANLGDDMLKASVDGSGNINLEEATGAGVIIRGRYYQQEDQLIIHARIVNAANGEIIHAPDPIRGARSEMSGLLDNLTQKVLGFWAVRDQSRFTQNPPRYEAYKLLKGAERLWGDNEHSEKIEHMLTEAYQIDPDFAAPLLKLAVFYSNPGPGNSDEMRDSIHALLDRSDLNFTRWEKLRYAFIKSSLDGNRLKSAQINEKMYDMDPSDGTANFNAGFNYICANMPAKGVNILNAFDMRYRDMDQDMSWHELRQAQGYFMLGKYARVEEVAAAYPFPKMPEGIPSAHLRSLVRRDSISAIKPELEKYAKMGIYSTMGQVRDRDALLIQICDEAYLLNKRELLKEYVGFLKNWTEKNSDPANYLPNMARIAFYNGNFKESLAYLEKQTLDPNRRVSMLKYISRRGVCYALSGNKTKAEELLAQLANYPNPIAGFPVHVYAQARILTALGRYDEAIETLKKANAGGIYFGMWSFWRNDIYLKPLYGHAEFEEFVRVKG